MQILFVTSEVEPFSKTGGLADVSAALPKALERLGHKIYVITPKYKMVDEKKLGKVIGSLLGTVMLWGTVSHFYPLEEKVKTFPNAKPPVVRIYRTLWKDKILVNQGDSVYVNIDAYLENNFKNDYDRNIERSRIKKIVQW